MQRKVAFIASVAALTLPVVTQAELPSIAEMTPGYTYYNMPGASVGDHDNEVLACATEAFKVESYSAQANSYMTGLIPDLLSAASNRGAFAISLENCMVVHGWRVVRVPDNEGKKLSTLAPEVLAAELSLWVGADQPHGEIVRVWGNDAANAAVKRYANRPKHDNDGLLSFRAATLSTSGRMQLPAQSPVKVGKIDAKWPSKPLKPADIATTLPGAGVIVVQLKGVSLKNGIGIALTRIGPDKDTYPSTIDHAPDALNFQMSTLSANDKGKFLAFAAPPGRWRIAAMNVAPRLGFCLGAPSFAVEAGEVIYAGSFDLGASDIGPDLSLDVPKAWLAGEPAADAIRPAVYINGSQGRCGYNGIYALEINGAPYEEGYKWGGAVARPRGAPPPK
jgi:hypothetical protein